MLFEHQRHAVTNAWRWCFLLRQELPCAAIPVTLAVSLQNTGISGNSGNSWKNSALQSQTATEIPVTLAVTLEKIGNSWKRYQSYRRYQRYQSYRRYRYLKKFTHVLHACRIGRRMRVGVPVRQAELFAPCSSDGVFDKMMRVW